MFALNNLASGGTGFGATLGGATGIPFASQIGGLADTLFGAVGGLFGGHGIPDHEKPDLQRIADANQITTDQASAVCGFEESHSPKNYDEIVKDAANNNSTFLSLLANYNASHASAPIMPGNNSYWGSQYSQGQQLGVQTLMGGAQGLLPLKISSPIPLPSSLGSPLVSLPAQISSPVPVPASLTTQQVKDAGQAAYDGAVKGFSDSLMKTDEGKQAQWSGVEQFVKDNGWWLTPIGLASVFGLLKAAKIIK